MSAYRLIIATVGKSSGGKEHHIGIQVYGRGSSYANHGQHYARGHYSRNEGMTREGGYNSRRDSRGRYSRDDGRSEMMEHLEMALDSATEQDREDIRRFIKKLGNA